MTSLNPNESSNVYILSGVLYLTSLILYKMLFVCNDLETLHNIKVNISKLVYIALSLYVLLIKIFVKVLLMWMVVYKFALE